jgi:hypothetical protein
MLWAGCQDGAVCIWNARVRTAHARSWTCIQRNSCHTTHTHTRTQPYASRRAVISWPVRQDTKAR